MKKTTSKKILKYGAMSAAILGAADVAGQVVYTDVEPDEVIATGGSFNIDLNDDGTNDFNPQVFDAAGGAGAVLFPTGSGSNGNQGSNGNGFVGFANGNFEYPSNLSAGAVIDGAAAFLTDARGDLNFYGCAYSGSQFCDGVVDGYMGVSFELAGNTHYGWIRVDLSADASTFTIKDFAFNATPDGAIEAGEGILGVDDFSASTIRHYFNYDTKVLTLNSQAALKDVVLYNVLGQESYRSTISSNISEHSLSGLQSGIYIAKINSTDNKSKTIKIVVK